MCSRVRSMNVGAAGLLAAVTVISLTAGAQDGGLQLRPQWKAGDVRVMELVRQRAATRSGTGESQQVTTRSEIEVRVLSAGPEGSVVQWQLGEVRFDDPDQAKDPGVAELLGMAHHVRYELDVGPDGAIRGLRNWTDVRALAQGATARLLETMRQKGVPSPTRAAISSRITALYSTERQILAYSLKELSLYHLAFGKRYELSTPITAQERLPNAFGGEPFPATTSFTLARLDEPARQAVIEWKQTVDPVEARRIMVKAMTDAAARTRRPAPTEADLPSIEIGAHAEMVVDIDTGALKSLRLERVSRVGPSSQTDSSTLTEKPRY